MSNKDIDNILNNIDDFLIEGSSFVEQNIEDVIKKHKETRRISRRRTIFEVTLLFFILIPMSLTSDNNSLNFARISLFFVASYYTIVNYHFYKKLDEQDMSVTIDDFMTLRKKITENGKKMLRRGRYFIYPLTIIGIVSNILYEVSQFQGFWYYLLITIVVGVGLLTFICLEKSIKEFEQRLKDLE
jgi:hypothetical protein